MQDGLTAMDHAAFLGHKKITAFLLEQNAETSKKSPVSWLASYTQQKFTEYEYKDAMKRKGLNK